MDLTVHDDKTDFTLGIGKIQLFKSFDRKLFLTISDEIKLIQTDFILPLLKSKNRIFSTWTDIVDSLQSEQT